MSAQIEKNMYETGLSYSPNREAMRSSRTLTNAEMENVVPCAASVQGFISTLNQKKFQLKNLMVEKQKLSETTQEQ